MKVRWRILLVFIGVIFFGCGGGGSSDGGAVVVPGEISERTVRRTIALIASEQLDDFSLAAQALSQAATQLTKQPTAANLQIAQAAWIQAEGRYALTVGLSFEGSPAAQAASASVLSGPIPLSSAIGVTPVDVSAIDSEASGVVVDFSAVPEISKSVLAALRTQNGYQTVTGLHAIELLLWGERESAAVAGRRSASDFIDGELCGSFQCQRRSALLLALCELLEEDAFQLATLWNPEGGAFGRSFSETSSPTLAAVYRGYEQSSRALAASALSVSALRAGNESSRFSGRTDLDVYFAILGMEQVIRGIYLNSEGREFVGPSTLNLLTEEGNRQIASDLKGSFSSTVNFLEGIFKEAESGTLLRAQIESADSRRRVIDAALAALVQAAFLSQTAELLSKTP